eukprot:1551348-Rhodomonas_salina.2
MLRKTLLDFSWPQMEMYLCSCVSWPLICDVQIDAPEQSEWDLLLRTIDDAGARSIKRSIFAARFLLRVKNDRIPFRPTSGEELHVRGGDVVKQRSKYHVNFLHAPNGCEEGFRVVV